MKTSSVKTVLVAFLCIAVISAASGDSDRRDTRPKLAHDGRTASDVMSAQNSASETEAVASRTRPKRFFEISRPKRSQETNQGEETIEGALENILKRMQRINDHSQTLGDVRSSRRQDTEYMILELWEEFCRRDYQVFDRQSVSCVEDNGNVPESRGWGNPGGVPGK